MHTDKQTIRESLLPQRDALTADEVATASAAIRERLVASPYYPEAGCVNCYVSFGREVDTHHLINRALGDGKRVSVPLCQEGRQLIHREIRSLDDLSPSRFGLLEPTNPDLPEVDPLQFDLVLIPGLAFDLSGNRIGFGAGYYDGFLSRISSPKVALAYDFQVLDTIPTEPHDIPLDAIITQSRILRCNP